MNLAKSFFTFHLSFFFPTHTQEFLLLLLHGLCDTLQANGSQSLLWQLWLLLGTRHEATRSNQSQIVSISLSHASSLASSHTRAYFAYFG